MPRKGRGSKTQPIQAAPGQEYGARAAQEASMRAVPLPAVPPLLGSSGTAPFVTPLDAGTSRPGEPVTTGLASGPGAGPEALGIMPGDADDILAELQGLYLAYPNEDLRRTLEVAQRRVKPSQEGAI